MEKLILTNYSIEDFQNIIKSAVRSEIEKIIKETQEKDLLNRKEVSQFLQVSIRTMQSWSDQGLIPFMRLGGKIYYSKKAVIDAMEKLEAFGLKRRRF